MECFNCNSENIVYQEYYYVCTDCAMLQPYNYILPEKNDYATMDKSLTYSCVTYFKRILKCLQDKSNSSVPEYIFCIIENEKDMPLKQILKKHKLFSYYILIPQIESILYRKRAVQIAQDKEERLIKLFSKVEKQIRFLHPERKQILRYKPVLKRLLLYIGLREISDMIPDLKTYRARMEFDRIWAQIKL